jgi:prepilin-type N-terminal cleavage/methylation domain-containing protein
MARQPSPPRQRRTGASERGFTLLEVLVAVTITGAGLAMAWAGIAGALRLMERSTQHEAARVLAQGKMDEILATGLNQLADDTGELEYAGQRYGYRVRLSPADVLPQAVASKVPLGLVLEAVQVEVFWGEQSQAHNLTLHSFRQRPLTAAETAAQAASGARAPPSANPAAAARPGSLAEALGLMQRPVAPAPAPSP